MTINTYPEPPGWSILPLFAWSLLMLQIALLLILMRICIANEIHLTCYILAIIFVDVWSTVVLLMNLYTLHLYVLMLWYHFPSANPCMLIIPWKAMK